MPLPHIRFTVFTLPVTCDSVRSYAYTYNYMLLSVILDWHDKRYTNIVMPNDNIIKRIITLSTGYAGHRLVIGWS
jgi:hypothetical protein